VKSAARRARGRGGGEEGKISHPVFPTGAHGARNPEGDTHGVASIHVKEKCAKVLTESTKNPLEFFCGPYSLGAEKQSYSQKIA
jgi:hypothetical protein